MLNALLLSESKAAREHYSRIYISCFVPFSEQHPWGFGNNLTTDWVFKRGSQSGKQKVGTTWAEESASWPRR